MHAFFGKGAKVGIEVARSKEYGECRRE